MWSTLKNILLCWKNVAHWIDHHALFSDFRLGQVVVEHISPVRRELVAQEDVGQAKVKDQNQKIEKLAEDKVSKVSVRLVLQDVVVPDVVVDGRLHAGLVYQNKCRFGIDAKVSNSSSLHKFPKFSG